MQTLFQLLVAAAAILPPQVKVENDQQYTKLQPFYPPSLCPLGTCPSLSRVALRLGCAEGDLARSNLFDTAPASGENPPGQVGYTGLRTSAIYPSDVPSYPAMLEGSKCPARTNLLDELDNLPAAKNTSPDQQSQQPLMVGEIYIVGNDKTPISEIVKHVDMYPGQVLTVPELRLAEQRLRLSGLFKVNRRQGNRPTISVIEGDLQGDFRDILVRVKEWDD